MTTYGGISVLIAAREIMARDPAEKTAQSTNPVKKTSDEFFMAVCDSHKITCYDPVTGKEYIRIGNALRIARRSLQRAP